MITRGSKIVLIWSVALFATLVAYTNIVDYQTNFTFVVHVMSMDTIFENSAVIDRAITSSELHRAAYNIIIATEAAIALICGWGGARLLRQLRSADAYNRAKGPAIVGLVLGMVLWFLGFVVIGGEWFMMWESQHFNAQSTSIRFGIIIGVILLYVTAKDADSDP